MLSLPPKEVFQKQYIRYAEAKFHLIKQKYGNIAQDISLKLPHGIAMMNATERISRRSGLFNDTYYLSSALDGCFHDIGRFEQYYQMGSLNDALLEKKSGIKDHGNLGKKILLANDCSFLKEIVPEGKEYWNVFYEVIGEHTTVRNHNYQYPISSLTHSFQDFSLEEVLKSRRKEKINQLIALKIAILQEADSLEIFSNIMNGRWTPFLSSNPKNFVADDVWNDFMNFHLIDMKKYKDKGSWTANSGFLLRYSLLVRKTNFVATLKDFQEENGFQRIWQKTVSTIKDGQNQPSSRIDSKLIEAQKYIQLAVHNLILTSPDGFLITKDSREEAKKLE